MINFNSMTKEDLIKLLKNQIHKEISYQYDISDLQEEISKLKYEILADNSKIRKLEYDIEVLKEMFSKDYNMEYIKAHKKIIQFNLNDFFHITIDGTIVYNVRGFELWKLLEEL